MNTKTLTIKYPAIAGLVLALLLSPPMVVAEEESIEEVITTGTRKQGVSPTETLSPIDVLGGDALSNQAQFDMTEGLSKVAPSINTQRFPIADGTAFIRPVSLRNLSPDQTLVLVNGERRHRSPLVNLQIAPLGTVNQGSHAVDYSALPAAAIKRVEILRDGASAQYGSDAIAGVINVILKDASEGFSGSIQTGEYFEGDGTRTTISANVGLPLGQSGFLNATAERSTADITSRGVARPDAQTVASVVGASEVPLNGLGQRWGDPDVETMKFFVNAGVPLSDAVDLYAHASYSDNETISDFFYRGPVLPAENMFNARTTLQIDDDGDFEPDPAPQSLVDEINAANLSPDDYLVADTSSSSGYVLRNPAFTRFPGGYNPNFGADIQDFAIVVGARGEFAGGTSWDFSFRSAESEADYRISSTINPSLGRLSPDAFRPGTLTQEETSANIDFVRVFDDVGDLASPLNTAFGLEFRRETYEIGAGDQPSIVAGPTAAFFGVGSDGFQGFPVESAGSFDSDSIAAYVDFEADLTERVSGGLAFRYEDYDEFGNTFDWKVSGRFDVNDEFALRGTVNTGFRAPTPGQVNTLNVTTSADSDGNLIPNGTYPVSHPVARALGSKPLVPEESNSFTFGAIWTAPGGTNFTADFYRIEIEDRLALLNFTIGPDEVTALDNAGVENAALLEGSLANFFVNGFESEITGIDVSINRDFDYAGGNLNVDFRHNWNEQDVSKVVSGTINQSRVFDLENQVPNHRSVLTFNYDSGGRFDGYVRFNRYGEWGSTGGLFSPGDASDAASYDGEILVDVEVNFSLTDNFRLTVGGENIFDTFPDKEQDGVLQFLGVVHSLTSPFGFNGGFWYARLTADF